MQTQGYTSVGVGMGSVLHVGIPGANRSACGARSPDGIFAATLGTLGPHESVNCRRCLKAGYVDRIPPPPTMGACGCCTLEQRVALGRCPAATSPVSDFHQRHGEPGVAGQPGYGEGDDN